jgi:hypothetical protein
VGAQAPSYARIRACPGKGMEHSQVRSFYHSSNLSFIPTFIGSEKAIRSA